MNDSSLLISLTVALSTLVGTAVGGYLSLLGTRRQNFLENIKKQHRNACEQIKAYYNLEMIYSEAVAKQSGRPRETVLKEFRSQVEEADSVRPTWTERDAQESINRFC
jgi:hypothetical protein